MESRAYFLKYRPQTVSELGIAEVRDNLARIFKAKNVPQAFLFTGTKGAGKTSAARIIAKVVNCLDRKEGQFEPCNKCDACVSITKGSAVDLIEIDAASNRGIDDIRALKDKVRLMPAKLKYKVYIIDEVHMLTTEAFNALLKTLEEPPEHSVFILCTTNPEKVPATIISRCLHFNFRKATQTEMETNLNFVVRAEGIKVDPKALTEIAKSADGSFRDGQKVLEQLSTGRSEITLDEAQLFLGKNQDLTPRKLIGILSERKLDSALKEIQRLADSSADFTVFLGGLMEDLRLILLANLGVTDKFEAYHLAEAKKFTPVELKALLELLLKAGVQMKTSPIPQLPLELVVVEWLKTEKVTNTKESKAESIGQDQVEEINIGEKAETEKKENLVVGENTQTVAVKAITVEEDVTMALETGEIRQIDDETWKKILLAVKPMNHSIEALLRAARPLKMQNMVLTLEVFYKFHKDQLEQNKRREIVEGACSVVLGGKVQLKCILGQKATIAKITSEKTDPDAGESDIIDIAEGIFNGERH
jgi:DNA polymerase III subunit gamma/tau